MKRQKGFTLIELLVVVAIIGILATVVLGSLRSAQDKAADAKIKAQLQSIHPTAILFYDDNGSYTNICADTKVAAMVTSAGATCVDGDGTGFAAYAALDNGDEWCVDADGYTGVAADTPADTGAGANCS